MDGNAEKAARSLMRACDEAEMGLLKGAREVLDKHFELQTAVFCDVLSQRVGNVLNGTDDDTWQNAVKNKAGKAGWLWDYLNGMDECFNKDQKFLEGNLISAENSKKRLLNEVEMGSISQGSKGGNANLVDEMMRNDRKQEPYLAARQAILEVNRRILMIKADLKLVMVFRKYIQGLIGEVNRLIQIIALNKSCSMVAALEGHKQNIAQILYSARKALNKVRGIIDLEGDEKSKRWEREQFEKYTQDAHNGSAVENILKDFQWRVLPGQTDIKVNDILTNESVTKSISQNRIILSLQGFETENTGILRSNQMDVPENGMLPEDQRQIANANIERLRRRCLNQFLLVWDDLSVLDYLHDIYGHGEIHFTDVDFARQVVKNGDVLLGFANDQPDSRAITNLIGPAPRNPEETNWCDQVSNNIRVEIGADQELSKYVPIGNLSSMYYFSMMDLINLKTLKAYQNGALSYKALPAHSDGVNNTREIYHLFKEEQNTVGYFDPENPLGPRVVDVMEDMSKLDLFIDAMSLGLFQEVNANDHIKHLQISIPPQKEDRDGAKIRTRDFRWILTDKANFTQERPYWIVAATKFCKGEGIVPPDAEPLEDLYSRLAQHVEQMQKKKLGEMLPKWKNPKRKSDVPIKASEAISMRGGKDKNILLDEACKAELYENLLNVLKGELSIKQRSLASINQDQVKNFPAETVYLKDEIAFIKWVIQKLTTYISVN